MQQFVHSSMARVRGWAVNAVGLRWRFRPHWKGVRGTLERVPVLSALLRVGNANVIDFRGRDRWLGLGYDATVDAASAIAQVMMTQRPPAMCQFVMLRMLSMVTSFRESVQLSSLALAGDNAVTVLSMHSGQCCVGHALVTFSHLAVVRGDLD
jgi:hypothetical protein